MERRDDVPLVVGFRNLPRPVGPGDLQSGHVGGRDLVQRRVARAGRRAAPIAPVAAIERSRGATGLRCRRAVGGLNRLGLQGHKQSGQERQGQNAREIAERAGQLYDKFVAFIADLDEMGSRLQQLDKAYAGARNKLVEGRGNLIGRAENLKLLGARASKSLPAELLERAADLPALDELGE